MTTKTSPFDPSALLDDQETQALYLAEVIRAAQEDGNPSLITSALGDIARARGMTEIAEKAGVSRAALYKALSEDGDPRLSTLLGVLRALGVEVTVKTAA